MTWASPKPCIAVPAGGITASVRMMAASVVFTDTVRLSFTQGACTGRSTGLIAFTVAVGAAGNRLSHNRRSEIPERRFCFGPA
jgi:hypothetical protein